MKTVKVWDLFVRIFHWTVVAAVIVQLLSAEADIRIHAASGKIILLLAVLRIIWGFVGPKHARFTDFIYSPREIGEYLAGLVKRNPRHYLGHNPAGGMMVVALLLFLLMTTLTGLKTYGASGNGPLAYVASSFISDAHAEDDSSDSDDNRMFKFWKEIHEAMADTLITLAVLHILGVIVSSYIHKENLILAMITGRKKIPE